MCISHFTHFSLILLFFKSSSGCFSFSMIFSFIAIFHVLQWTFLNFPPFFSFLRNITRPKLRISHFLRFSVLSPYSRSYSVHFSFFTFFSDFVIFQVVKWMFLIFHDFQFSCHIPRPTVDISKFSSFFQFSSPYFTSYSVYFSFSVIFSFLAIFQVLQCAFLIFHVF